MQAIYISSNQFKVSIDKTEEFLAGRRIRALCGLEYKYSTVYSSVYSSPYTIVTLEESELTSNLSEVHYGIINIGDQGSFPKHSHEGTEGTGGSLSLLTLSDTPSAYDELRYLKTTNSGIEFSDDLYTESEVDTISGSLQTNIDGKSDTSHLHDDRYYTESEVDTISGTLQTNIDAKSDTEWFLTEGVPSDSIGVRSDIAIDYETGDIYKRLADSGGSGGSGTFYPAASGDDGYIYGTAFRGEYTYLKVGNTSVPTNLWIRFVNLNISPESVITTCYIRWKCSSSYSTILTKIYGNDVDNAVAPVDVDGYNALALTAGVDYDGSASNGAWYESPSLISILQPVVNRGGWSRGNSFQVVWKDDGSGTNRVFQMDSFDKGLDYPELHITWEAPPVIIWDEKLTPDFLKLADTPSSYDEGKYLKTTNSGIEFSDELYTKSEVDTISGSLQTNIDDKVVWYLTEGEPTILIGKEDDLAIDQSVGDIYERGAGGSENLEIFYVGAGTDDGNFRVGSYSNSTNGIEFGNYYSQFWNGFFRFPNITIPKDSTIVDAFVRLTGYGNTSGTSYLNIYFNEVDNAVAPSNETQAFALALTDPIAWDDVPAWSNTVKYDTVNIATLLQEIVNRSGWASGNAVQIIVNDNGGDSGVVRECCSMDYLSGVYKTELHITYSTTAVWDKKLSPDFIKLSDTPTTYSGSADKYLKTTNSGIEFSDELYTKSEVDTISGSLQTNIDGKSDTSHLHDDRYYTESEVDTVSGTLQTNIDSMPTTLLELADTPTTYSGSSNKYLKTTNSGIEFSDIDSEYWESVGVFLDENYSNDKGLPVQVERGLFKGYSMPIWSTPVHQYEELVFRIRVPFRWDGITDPIFLILVSTSATEDIGDKFKFQMEWESKGVSEVIPDTTAETLSDEVTVTDGTAYYSYLASANLDSTKLISGENLQFRIRRIAAAEPQVSNEIIIWHWDSRWKMNKLGTITE